jgi:predicted dehydrogenase
VIKVGLAGLGYWGPNIARVLYQSSRCEFVACCELDAGKLEKATRQFPRLRGVQDFQELLRTDIDAVVIATPISTHYGLVRDALRAGKHVMVEKPLADNYENALDLVAEQKKADRVLMTGHTFLYSPPVVKVKELIESGVIGKPYYASFSRVNLGGYQKDVDVVWDLAVHDVSILLYWLGEVPSQASSFGRHCIQQQKRDVAFVWMEFPSGVVASCEVSWLSPQKVRRTILAGSERMVLYDDLEPSEKIKIYNRGVNVRQPETFGEFQLTYRMGDMVAPALENVEPLAAEMDHFIHCIETGETPRTDGNFGAQVVRVIEMATRSS